MGVVFDEVTATVDAQRREPSPPENTENSGEEMNPAVNLQQLIETQQRRAKRLWAD